MVKIIVLACILLVGCSVPTKVVTQEVITPVLSCPKPIILTKPTLPINEISETDSIGVVALKYKATVYILLDYINQQERVLELYR